jgi:enoyl-CoA hydratase/carnithine racemase
LLLLTGRRVSGADAVAIGLADQLVPQGEVRAAAQALAAEVASSGPLAVQSIRATLRGGLAEAVVKATEHELAEQSRLRKTQDFGEGIKAMSERRPPVFTGE